MYDRPHLQINLVRQCTIVRLRTRLKTLPQKALKPMIQTPSLEWVKPDSAL